MLTNGDMAALAVIVTAQGRGRPGAGTLAQLAEQGLLELVDGGLRPTAEAHRRLSLWGRHQAVGEVVEPQTVSQGRLLLMLAQMEREGRKRTYRGLAGALQRRSYGRLHKQVQELAARGMVRTVLKSRGCLALTAAGWDWVRAQAADLGTAREQVPA